MEMTGFKCSYGYITNLMERNGLKTKKRTTNRQQTITTYLNLWPGWIRGIRDFAIELNIVDEESKRMKPNHNFNIDEFGISGATKVSKGHHIVPGDAQMINVTGLMTTRAPDYRMATIAGLMPSGGFNVGM